MNWRYYDMDLKNIGNHPIRQKLTHLLRLEKIMFIFWFFFWALNGLDKFFNGAFMKNDQWGKWYQGWFGVNRDEKFIHYFSRLDLPPWMALSSLYVFAIVEIIVGFIFLKIAWEKEPKSTEVRMCFKTGIILFVLFMIGDIMFGDRMELWEHGTFLILTLMTYRLYLSRFDEYAELVGEREMIAADLNQDGKISSAEYHVFMERVRLYGVERKNAEKEEEESKTSEEAEDS
ncbi:MAG: hypothetical protein AAGH89_03985 [Verrucomicrobiota bacterium]